MDEIRIIDRRGQREPPSAPKMAPDQVTAIRQGERLNEFIAVFPGNAVPEVRFTADRQERAGFRLISNGVTGLSKPNAKRVMAAQARIRQVCQQALKQHLDRVRLVH